MAWIFLKIPFFSFMHAILKINHSSSFEWALKPLNVIPKLDLDVMTESRRSHWPCCWCRKSFNYFAMYNNQFKTSLLLA